MLPRNNEKPFEKFALRVPVEPGWFTEEVIPDLVFYDLARSIGLGERKFLVEKMRQTSQHRDMKRHELNLGFVRDVVDEMAAAGNVPSAILLPIDLYKDVVLRWDPSGRFIRHGVREHLITRGMDVLLEWSNKYTPFQECFVVSKQFAKWTAKNGVRDRLEVIFEREGSEFKNVTVQTVFRFEPWQADAVTMITLGDMPAT